jgi:hypothetical protein
VHEVAYVNSETREGGLAQATLDQSQGVFVPEFCAVYDSLNCPQQKCLIHLMRELNGAILDDPYDQEMKQLVRSLGELLKRIVEEVDRRGAPARPHNFAVGLGYDLDGFPQRILRIPD